LGRLPEAIAELQKAIQLSGGVAETGSGLGVAYSARGEKTETRKILEDLKTQSQPYVPPYNVAALYASIGEKEHALEYLQEAHEEGSFYMSLVMVDPELDGIRSDPRYADLLRRMGLPRKCRSVPLLFKRYPCGPSADPPETGGERPHKRGSKFDPFRTTRAKRR
jgi:tetratricopeptide (TPR) repeat protein